MQLRDLLPVALLFVVATIAISIGADILSDVRAGQTAGSWERNVTDSGLKGMGTLGDWIPTLALVSAAAIVIGVLVYSFMGGRK
jgi:hypothetical protein